MPNDLNLSIIAVDQRPAANLQSSDYNNINLPYNTAATDRVEFNDVSPAPYHISWHQRGRPKCMVIVIRRVRCIVFYCVNKAKWHKTYIGVRVRHSPPTIPAGHFPRLRLRKHEKLTNLILNPKPILKSTSSASFFYVIIVVTGGGVRHCPDHNGPYSVNYGT